MSLTAVKTEKVYGRISNVHIGYDATHGVNITNGILGFEYHRIHDAVRNKPPGAATSATINLQQPSHFEWKLTFLSDSRVAFFATDVQVAGGNQYALVDNGSSNKIEYFKVIMTIQDSAGAVKTRTYTVTNGYCLRNSAMIGKDDDAIFEYEGEAEYISYADA
ncbi:hypothetical protein MUO83_07840 [Candidatus Bathyarchaeota archaeon]|nr:hypothetical protein [Candidatus Bathyarchaeota archaeon]